MPYNDVKIDQVAKQAGVSKSTISRYLNGKFEFMSLETRNRICEVIKELGYRPSNIARSLKSEKSGLLGCVVSDITNPFSALLFKGVADVCERENYRVMFSHSSQDAKKEIECVEAFLDNRVDGLIIHTTSFNCNYLYDLKQKGLHIVLADLVFADEYQFDSVSTQNYKATYECIAHLHGQGYKNIGFFADGGLNISSHLRRYEGYKDAMKKFYGIDLDSLRFESFPERSNIMQRQIINFLEKNKTNAPNAIFAVNGMVLFRVLTTMRELGIEINGNPGVCGFDGWGWTPLVGPGITNVRQDAYGVGVRAAEVLLERIEGRYPVKDAQHIELPNTLVKRGSTCPYLI